MWSDNETTRDFLNFRHVASIVAEMIIRAEGKPLSIGVSGSWGVGKSSMVQLIGESLTIRGDDKFLIVPFNAWLYQGYDDVRAALMETITQALLKRAEGNATVFDKARELAGRVDWFRAAGLTIGSAASVLLGHAPIGLVAEAVGTIKALTGPVDEHEIESATETAKKVVHAGTGIIKPKKRPTPPAAIEAFRTELRDTLKTLGVTLVVLIDDLDRCLPPTTISTLEAIRLFLFLDGSAFVIAADDRMIRQAVQAHFGGMSLDDQLVTSYFDKLIQVPLRVPPLGTQDVRAYLMLLFIDHSDLDPSIKDELRTKVCEQLGKSWKGMRVDRTFVLNLLKDWPPALAGQLDLADRLAPILTTASQIAGNPRLIKRFLNTVEIRMAIAGENGVAVDEGVLAKLHLLERCGDPAAYSALLKAVNQSDEGKPQFLESLENVSSSTEKLDDLPKPWDAPFAREWVRLKPHFSGLDLRAAVYVSREHHAIIASEDQISAEGLGLLQTLIAVTSMNPALVAPVKALAEQERGLIMDRLLEKARAIESWGTPAILFGCLIVADSDSKQASKFCTFLLGVPPNQLTPALVPLLAAKAWAAETLQRIAIRPKTPQPVRKAIETKDA